MKYTLALWTFLCLMISPSIAQEAEISLGENDVKAMIFKWFSGSDSKLPYDYYLTMMDDDVVMCLPKDTIRSKKDFIDWRQTFSARLTWNRHELEKVEVKQIDATHWYASLEIDWRGLTVKGDKLAKHIHQDWYIENKKGHLSLLKRIVALKEDGDMDRPFLSKVPQVNDNTAKQFVYEWLGAMAKGEENSYFSSRLFHRPILNFNGKELRDKNDLNVYLDDLKSQQKWLSLQPTSMHVKSFKGKWIVSFDLDQLLQTYNDTFEREKRLHQWTLVEEKGRLKLMHVNAVLKNN